MSRHLLAKFVHCAFVCSTFAWIGCGGSSEPTESSESAASETASQAGSDAGLPQLPTASIGSADEPLVQSEPEEGSAVWLIEQIKNLRSVPVQNNGEQPDLEKLRAARRERNLKIIELATEAISKTHEEASQEAQFNEAVRQLLEARLQLAYQGETEDIDALYADAELLRGLEEHRTAAAEATHTLVMFANTNAGRFGAREPRWLEEFARQAMLFASEFPEDSRAVPALFAAAISCDLHQQTDDAIRCLTAITTNHADTAQAAQAAPILRRLQLSGKPLDLAGPTLQGDFIRVNDFEGKFVLVVFWSSDNEGFQKMAPATVQVARKYAKYMETIGVCLDEDEVALNAYLDKADLPWKNIFDPAHRRWDNKIVAYYGIRSIPTFWLVDHKGIVKLMTSDASQLDEQIKNAMLAVRDELQR